MYDYLNRLYAIAKNSVLPPNNTAANPDQSKDIIEFLFNAQCSVPNTPNFIQCLIKIATIVIVAKTPTTVIAVLYFSKILSIFDKSLFFSLSESYFEFFLISIEFPIIYGSIVVEIAVTGIIEHNSINNVMNKIIVFDFLFIVYHHPYCKMPYAIENKNVTEPKQAAANPDQINPLVICLLSIGLEAFAPSSIKCLIKIAIIEIVAIPPKNVISSLYLPIIVYFALSDESIVESRNFTFPSEIVTSGTTSTSVAYAFIFIMGDIKQIVQINNKIVFCNIFIIRPPFL